MPHPFHRRGRPVVFAHRGGARVAPENTLAAFDAGLACGADGLELDVRLSADGVAVVIHDARLDRTTDRSGPVSALTADELMRVDAGFAFDSQGAYPFRGQGIGIPRLRDVLARYRDVPLIIELKEDTAGLVDAVLADVRRSDALERVCIGSFSQRALRQVRQRMPEMVTSAARAEVRWALWRSRWGFPARRVPYLGFQVPEVSRGRRVVSPKFVEDAHAANLLVQVWTVDREPDAERLLTWGVDGLITDRPDVIVPFLRARVSQQS